MLRVRSAVRLGVLGLLALAYLLSSGASVADSPNISMSMAQPGVYDSSSGESESGAAGGPTVASVDSSGTLSTSYPFALMKARGHAQPSLALSYSAGNRRGLAGVGWTIGLPSIERRNLSGSPRYQDPPAGTALDPKVEDRFVFNGQPLVPICFVQGGECPGAVGERMPDFAQNGGWHYFRLVNDGSFARFFWSGDHLTWVIQFKSGETLELGQALAVNFLPQAIDYDELRGVIPITGTGTINLIRPFRWSLVAQYDSQINGGGPTLHPNHVLYAWSKLSPKRASLGYLTDIYDTRATAPGSGDKGPSFAPYAHHTRLAYELPPPETAPGLDDPPVWRAAPVLRLARVDVTSANWSNSGTRELVRRYRLGYSIQGNRSYLSSVQLEGRCDSRPREDASGALPDVTNCPPLPPTTFEYLAPFMTFNVRPIFGVVPDKAFIFDVNGDGIPDFVGPSADGQSPQQVALLGTGTARDVLGIHGTMTVPAWSSTKTLSPLSGGVGSGIVSPAGVTGLVQVLPFALPLPPQDPPLPPAQIGLLTTFTPHQVSSAQWQWNAESPPKGVGPFGANAKLCEMTDSQCQPHFVQKCGESVCACFPAPMYPCGFSIDSFLGTTDFDGDSYPDAYFSTISGDFHAELDGHGDVQLRLTNVMLDVGAATSARLPDGSLNAFQTPFIPALSRADAFAGTVRNASAQSIFLYGQTFFEDMDGDGLPDWVSLIDQSLIYWRGRGDGHADFCADPNTQCPEAEIVARGVSMTGVPPGSGSPNLKPIVHDVSGDGRPDLVYIGWHVVGNGAERFLTIHLNLDGRSFDSPIRIPVTQIPGFHEPETQLLFGDINGSGTEDIIFVTGNSASYVDLLDEVPLGLLRSINNGLGGTTDLAYRSTTQLARCARGSGECDGPIDATPWATQSPQALHVVTRVTTSNNLKGPNRLERVTEYSYSDPVWDGRELKFRGFQRVRTRVRGAGLGQPSDPRDPATTTETKYLTGLCDIDYPADQGPPGHCPFNVIDRPFDVLTGLPLDIETRDDAGHVLSTVHNRYQITKARDGMDGRAVHFAFASETHTFLYDTSLGIGSPGTQPLDAIWIPELLTMVQDNVRVRSGAKTQATHLLKTINVDQFGNTNATIDYGQQGIDPPLRSTTHWDLPPGDVTGWLWRPFTTTLHGASPIAGAPTDYNRTTQYTYDSSGNLTTVAAGLRGTELLQRRHESGGHTAPIPSTASTDGLVIVERKDYDAYGNTSFVHGAHDIHCEETTYDKFFSQLQTVRKLFVEPGCSGAAVTSFYISDRGFEKVTISVAPDYSVSTIDYDAFGRPTRTTKPDPDTGAPSANATTVQYFDAANLYPILVETKPQLARTSTFDGTTASVSWAYTDGFGKGLFTISSADPAAGDPADWIVSGGEQRSTKGAIVAKHQPFFWKGDAAAYPIASGFSSAATTGNYDAFGRLLDKVDEAGNLVTRSIYHALSVDIMDADTKLGGARGGMYGTIVKDGHRRVIQTMKRMHTNAGVDLVTKTTAYSSAGQPRLIARSHSADPKTVITRTIGYDSFGRMVSNQEPNTSRSSFLVGQSSYMWRYAYDDDGNLVGTSDARGCGKNVVYDAAGRPLVEDYSPCLATQDDYSQLGSSGEGAEAIYVYEGGATPSGRLHELLDRASDTSFAYDRRGRTTRVARRLAKPDSGAPPIHLTDRYASHVFVAETGYDELNRVVRQSTGADAPELFGVLNVSEVSPRYSARGTVSTIYSSYGSLLISARYDADGLPRESVLGDAASTTRQYYYDDPLRRIKSTRIHRTAPAFWSQQTPGYVPPDPTEPTQQLDIEDLTFEYDAVGNPRTVVDSSDARQWPAGIAPRARAYQYDDLYRVKSVQYGGVDSFVSPFDWEQRSNSGNPVPFAQASTRIVKQSFTFDWLGNLVNSQDDEGLFYDRSLGDAAYSTPGPGPLGFLFGRRPNQLDSAQLAGSLGGSLSVDHDLAGNMIALRVIRRAPCASPQGCNQRFTYDWDEVGQLARARRYDFVSVPDTFTESHPFYGTPPATASADLRYAYDAGGTRILKLATGTDGTQVTTAEIFPTLRLEQAPWDSVAGDYVADKETEAVYLAAGGSPLARLVYSKQPLPTLNNMAALNAHLRVFYTLGDQLGSTSTVIDMETGEVVERASYQAFGASEADYRPARWEHFRENYRFTGKEEDIEVGLSYFGARYYAPALGQWISPDPLTIHGLQASLNPYAYVDGHVSLDVDTNGLSYDANDQPYSTDPYANPTVSALQSYTSFVPPELAAMYVSMLPKTGGEAFDAFAAGAINVPTDTLKFVVTVGWAFEKVLSDVPVASLGATLQEIPNIVEPPTSGLLFYMAGSALGGAVIGEVAGGASGFLRAAGAGRVGAAGEAADVAAAARVGAMTDEAVTAASPFCFVEGTVVWTDSGPQPIETIRVGDLVLARGDEGGEISRRVVLRTFARAADDVVDIDVSLADGGRQQLHATAGHRLWVNARGWVRAGELVAHDALSTTSGTAFVERVSAATPEAVAVFNLEVADDHTYFVGAAGVWVHNTGCGAGATPEYVNLAGADRTRHILYGDETGGGHLFPGLSGKSPFPQSWSGDKVMHMISDVATDPASTVGLGRGGRSLVQGTRDGVDITVVLQPQRRGGGIVTGFPTNVPRNP